jgi:hypothetical protein
MEIGKKDGVQMKIENKYSGYMEIRKRWQANEKREIRNKEKKYGAYVDIRKHRWRANEN